MRRRKLVVRIENVDVMEVDGSEEVDINEEEQHEDASPNYDVEMVRKNGCVSSEDECINELESD